MVSLSGGCLIHFETNGGSQIPDQSVALGGKVKKPDDPTKEGFYLEGWYSDMDLQNKWNFSKDTVSGNMTLYAKWDTQRHFSLLWILMLVLIVVVILMLLGRKRARVKRETLPANANSSQEREKEDIVQ